MASKTLLKHPFWIVKYLYYSILNLIEKEIKEGIMYNYVQINYILKVHFPFYF